MWRLVITYPPMTRATFAPVAAFAVAQRGQFESFQIVPAIISVPQGTIAGSTPLVNGASQTGRALIIDGLAISTTVLKAGDLCKLAGNDKVYMQTVDLLSDGSGNATMALDPALVASPADGEALTFTAVPFTVALTNDIQEFAQSVDGFFTYEADFEEVIS